MKTYLASLANLPFTGLERWVAPGVVAVALCACGSTGAGDAEPTVRGNVLGAGRRISSLVDPTAMPRPSPTELVTVTGARVTHVDGFDETKSGASGTVYLQDFTEVPGPYEGISTHSPSYSPPSFRVVTGDVVDATGQFQEFQLNLNFLKPGWTTPQLNGPNLELRFDAPYRPLVPAEISVDELTTYEGGRRWVSMLVTVRDVVLFEDFAIDKAGRGKAAFDVGSGLTVKELPTMTNELFDVGAAGLELKKGRKLASLTGIVTLFDVFHIAPRTAEDIQLAAP